MIPPTSAQQSPSQRAPQKYAPLSEASVQKMQEKAKWETNGKKGEGYLSERMRTQRFKKKAKGAQGSKKKVMPTAGTFISLKDAALGGYAKGTARK